MDDKVLKLDELLSHKPTGRVLEPSEIAHEFKLIRKAFEDEGKGKGKSEDEGVPTAESFRLVGAGSGTHLLKLITSRAPTGASVLRFEERSSNSKPNYLPSLDAKQSKVAKLVYRPWEIKSRDEARTLVDHILNPDDEISAFVIQGFGDAFGEDALEALRHGLEKPLQPIVAVPTEEFPIIFQPRPGGGDLQVTPLAPARLFVQFREVTEPFFQKQAEGQPRVPRGRWIKQFVADKPQNISSAIGKLRTRFLATMPRIQSSWESQLYRYAHGGAFPHWGDDGIVDAMNGYVKLLGQTEQYSNADMRDALDRRAERLIAATREFINETSADAQLALPDQSQPKPPTIVDTLYRCVPKNDRPKVRNALMHEHFKSLLQKMGEVS